MIKIPDISFTKRAISDIAFQCDDNIKLYATISEDPDDAVWFEISNGDVVNKAVSMFKIQCENASGRATIRLIMY